MYNSKLLLKTLIVFKLENSLVLLNNVHDPPALTFFFLINERIFFLLQVT